MGVDVLCAICGERIRPDQVEYELQFTHGVGAGAHQVVGPALGELSPLLDAKPFEHQPSRVRHLVAGATAQLYRAWHCICPSTNWRLRATVSASPGRRVTADRDQAASRSPSNTTPPENRIARSLSPFAVCDDANGGEGNRAMELSRLNPFRRSWSVRVGRVRIFSIPRYWDVYRERFADVLAAQQKGVRQLPSRHDHYCGECDRRWAHEGHPCATPWAAPSAGEPSGTRNSSAAARPLAHCRPSRPCRALQPVG
jgi:hypothetical protein